jgi:hypothetical protein
MRFDDAVLLTTTSRNSVREELGRYGKDFYSTCKERLTQRWKNCVENEGEFVEK